MEHKNAEASVIGGLVMFPEETADTYQRLTAECFGDEALRELYKCCLVLHREGKQVDPVTVEAAAGKELRPVLVKCCQVMPALAGYDAYVGIVRDDWRKREMRDRLAELAGECSEPAADPAAITAELGKLLDHQRELDAAVREETTKGFWDCVTDFYADLGKPNNALKVGWRDFDYMTGGLQRGGVYVISARSGMGKTDLALNMAMHLASAYRVNYNSMEMPRIQLSRRLVSRLSRINSTRLRDKKDLTQTDYGRIRSSLEIFQNRTQLTLDDQQHLTAEDVEAKILRYRPDVIFLDHLGLMDHGASAKQPLWEAIGNTTRTLKQMAMKYGIVIVELVQMGREADRDKGSPTMSQLKGSSSIENDADGIFMIKAQPLEEVLTGERFLSTAVHVVKNRHGSTGKLEFNWMPQYHSWIAIDRIREG